MKGLAALLDIPDEITGNMALGIYLAVGRKLWPLVLAHALIYSLDFVTHFFFFFTYNQAGKEKTGWLTK